MLGGRRAGVSMEQQWIKERQKKLYLHFEVISHGTCQFYSYFTVFRNTDLFSANNTSKKLLK